MYFAADLIRQYNKNNGTNKELKKCLQNKETIEMINLIYNGGMVPNLVPCYANAKNNKIYCENVIEYLNYLESKVEARILPSTSSRDENGLFLMKLNLSVGLLFNDCLKIPLLFIIYFKKYYLITK